MQQGQYARHIHIILQWHTMSMGGDKVYIVLPGAAQSTLYALWFDSHSHSHLIIIRITILIRIST